ncbi:TolC family protein [Sphingomonas daechungensis]|uniref:TolC family protein n=1 Tax=Sphingomonas daechungensis TaxID=1176646 RepID=UPI003782D494
MLNVMANRAMSNRSRVRAFAVATFSAYLLAACAVAPGGQGGIALTPSTAQRTTASDWSAGYSDLLALRQPLAILLSKEVDADAAVRIALLASPAMHRIYFDLRLPAEEVAATATGPLPTGEDVESRFVVDAIGSRQRSASQVDQLKFEQTKLDKAAEIVRFALDVRRAHASAVAARQISDLTESLKTASEASAELGRRMARVGNWPRLSEYREAAALGEVSVQAARARQLASVARERLTRLLGIWGDDAAYRLASKLPNLPSKLSALENAEASTIDGRFDIRSINFDIAAEVREFEIDGYEDGLRSAGLRFVEVPPSRALDGGKETVPINVPVFDLRSQAGQGKAAKFMALLTQASGLSISARADAREAVAAWRTAYDIARHYNDHMVPLQGRIIEESVQRYNGMLIGVFDLLADVRQRSAVEIAAVEAARDYWIAAADLRNALQAGGYSGGTPSTSSAISSKATPAGH